MGMPWHLDLLQRGEKPVPPTLERSGRLAFQKVLHIKVHNEIARGLIQFHGRDVRRGKVEVPNENTEKAIWVKGSTIGGGNCSSFNEGHLFGAEVVVMDCEHAELLRV